jgi:hypothetical protein
MKVIGIAGSGAGSGKDTVASFLHEDFHFARIALADPMKRFCAVVFNFDPDQLWGESKNAPDLRYDGMTAMPDEEWRWALSRLEARAPEWLEGLGLPPGTLAPLRVWFFRLMFEAHGLDYPLCDARPRTVLTPRRALQTLGTEWGRMIDESVWVRRMFADAEKLLSAPGYCYEPSVGIVEQEGAEPPAGVAVPDVRFPNEAEAIRARGSAVLYVDRPNAGLRGGESAHASENAWKMYLTDAVIPNRGSIDQLRWMTRNVFGWLLERQLSADAGEPPDAPPTKATKEVA